MGCGKSKHDVAVGNTVSQSKRLSSESKKNVEADPVAEETKDVAPREMAEVKGGEEKAAVTENNVAEAKDIVGEKKSEGSFESKDTSGSGTRVPPKEDEAKVEPVNVVEEKSPVEETKAGKETAEGKPEVAKEENPIKEEAEAAVPSVDEAKAPNATVRDENQATEKVGEADSATASNPKTE